MDVLVHASLQLSVRLFHRHSTRTHRAHNTKGWRMNRHSSWLHRAQTDTAAIPAQRERCHAGRRREVLGPKRDTPSPSHPPQACVGAGQSGRCHPGEGCLLRPGKGKTGRGTREPRESGWEKKGRHRALCRAPVLSWESGGQLQEESHVGTPSHTCLMGRFLPTHPSFMWRGWSAGAGHPVAGMWAL